MNPWAKKIAFGTLGAALSLEPVVNAAAADADQTELSAGGLVHVHVDPPPTAPATVVFAGGSGSINSYLGIEDESSHAVETAMNVARVNRAAWYSGAPQSGLPWSQF